MQAPEKVARLRARLGAEELRAQVRPAVQGEELLPEGAAVVAVNHVAPLHRLRLRLADRPVVFVGNDRESVDRGLAALARGALVAVTPEGERSPDGRLYRGEVAVAELALGSGAPVLPAAVVDDGRLLARSLAPRLVLGPVLDLDRFRDLDLADGPVGALVLRTVTDTVMSAVQRISGQTYMDTSVTARRRQLADERHHRGRQAKELTAARKAAEQARVQQKRADRAAEAAELAEARARAVEAARAQARATRTPASGRGRGRDLRERVTHRPTQE